MTESHRAFDTSSGRIILGDAFDIIPKFDPCSIHAVVSDPPYGIVEYSDTQHSKMKSGKGGVWRQPPAFDGTKRAPLPRFTTLTQSDIEKLDSFFFELGAALLPILVPGANVIIASNPLVAPYTTIALTRAGLEFRGNVIRLVQTMRGGDRPKGHEKTFSDVSVMPRSQWEPWILLRKPLDGTAANNLSKWKTGGFRRISDERPFGDVIKSHPTNKKERGIAPHPSLKPQDFMRQIVRASLPLGEGVVLDPFCGSGSTIAAADALGYESIGIERNEEYFVMAKEVIGKLSKLPVELPQ